MKEQTKLVWFIILLVAASQLALTIYLPSMPEMVSVFKTDSQHIQLSITVYLLGYGISQFFYGPLSDIYGRKKIILYGLSIFVIASLVCSLAWTVNFFLIGRILQGVGIGCGDTMGRAILCDRFEGQKFVKAASHIGVAATITPMLGPLLGGYIEEYSNWRLSFLSIFLYGLIALATVFFYLPETRADDHQFATTLGGIFKTYLTILKNRTFICFFLPGAASFLGEMAYNMQSSFLLQNRIGWGPIGFGWLNILIIMGLIIGTFIANTLAHRMSYIKMVSAGMCLLSFGSIFMFFPALFHFINTFTIIAPMLVFMAGVGITYPNTNTGALMPFSKRASGTAGALQGGLQMLFGGLMGIFLSGISIKTQLPLALTLTVLSLASHMGFVILLPDRK